MPTECDNVDLFANGALDEVRAEAFRRHLPGCPKCQAALDEHLQFRLLMTEYGKELPPLNTPPEPFPWHTTLRRRFLVGGLAAMGAVGALVLVLSLSGREEAYSAEMVLGSNQPSRSLKARLPHPALRKYRPFNDKGRAMMGASPASEPSLHKALEPFEEREDYETLVAAFLIRGNTESASDQLDLLQMRQGLTPDVMNYRAVIHLLDGRPKDAIEVLNKALEQDPKYALAFWNRALAHAALHQQADAARDFLAFADSSGEEDWSKEARMEAAALLQKVRPDGGVHR